MLGFAAIILGTVCALERRATGGVLAPVLTHFIWGLVMVLAVAPDVRRQLKIVSTRNLMLGCGHAL